MGGNLHSESYYLWRSQYFISIFIGIFFVAYFVIVLTHCFLQAKSKDDSRYSSRRFCKFNFPTLRFVETISRSASKAYLGAPLGLLSESPSDNTKLHINGQEVSKVTLLMLGSYVYFAVIAIVTITWDMFIIDYSSTCDKKFDCFLYDKNLTKRVPMTDCRIVNDGSSIACYRIAYNTNALAAAGGLIVIFKVIPFIVSSILLQVYYYWALWIEKYARKNIKHMFIFKELDSMKNYNQMKVMAIFLACFWVVMIGSFTFIRMKCHLEPSTFLKVAWLSFAIIFCVLIPWPKYISPRENKLFGDVKENEDREEEVVQLKEAREVVEEDYDEKFEHISKKEVYETVENDL